MKITFIEPPPLKGRTPERFAGCSYELYHFPDLANLYPFTCLHQQGYEVDYIDAVLEELSENAFSERIRRDNSTHYVVHSVILSKKIDLYYLNLISRLRPEVKFIVHGPEPTRVPEQYLSELGGQEGEGTNVLVFRGEIENNLMDYFKHGELKGVSLWEGDRIVHYPPSPDPVDLDLLPSPLRNHQVLRPHINSYFNPKFSKRPYTIMMASRGCSFNCLFCVPNSISFARELEYRRYFGKKPKPAIASSQRVIQEFKSVKEQGFNAVMVIDDQFLWGKERTLEICAGIKDLGLEWGCLSRADFLTDGEVVKALAQAGCISIDIGVESLNQQILDEIRKDLEVEETYEAIRLLKEYRINPKLNIMFGTSPQETTGEIKATVGKLKHMGVENVMFSIATPFKGTEFYRLCKKKGFLIDDSDEIDPFRKSVISYPGLPKAELEKLQRYAYKSFYLRPEMLLGRLRKACGGKSLLNDLKVAMRLLGCR